MLQGSVTKYLRRTLDYITRVYMAVSAASEIARCEHRHNFEWDQRLAEEVHIEDSVTIEVYSRRGIEVTVQK